MRSLCFDKAGLGLVTSSSDQSSRSTPSGCHCGDSGTAGAVVAGSICSMRVDPMGHDDTPALGLARDEPWCIASVACDALSFSLNTLSSCSRDFMTSCLKSSALSGSSLSTSFRSLISLSRDWTCLCHHLSATSSMSRTNSGQAVLMAWPMTILGSLTASSSMLP